MAVSLGTSDVSFGLMEAPRVDASGTGHVFGAPTGAFMGLTVFKNGSLARERVRNAFGMSWADFSRALSSTPAGNRARIFLPWYEPEITPSVQNPGVHRYGLEERDGPGHVRGVIEAQMMAIARHSRWMGVDVDTIYATGGAAANVQILQVMADVFNAEVYQLEVGNSAALGAALRAHHADAARSGQPISWDRGDRRPGGTRRRKPAGPAAGRARRLPRSDEGARGLRSARARPRAGSERHAVAPGRVFCRRYLTPSSTSVVS